MLRRILPLELVILLVALVLPWSAGPSAAQVGRGSATPRCLAAVIALKANAIVLGLLALLGGMDAVTLGHALGHLHVPGNWSTCCS